MTLRDALLPAVESARRLLKGFGLRQTRVILRTRKWVSGRTGEGPSTDFDVELGAGNGARPKVEDLGNGNFRISKIAPSFAAHGGGGWKVTDLLPRQREGTLTYLVLNGPDGTSRECRVLEVDIRHSFGYTVLAADRE